jgi:hypothetical protein
LLEKLLYLALGTLFGGLVGHQLALGRDKRKEFNEIAEPLCANLERLKARLEESDHVGSRIKVGDFGPVLRRLPERKRAAMERQLAVYEKAVDQSLHQDEYSDIYITDRPRVVAAILDLLPYVQLR